MHVCVNLNGVFGVKDWHCEYKFMHDNNHNCDIKLI